MTANWLRILMRLSAIALQKSWISHGACWLGLTAGFMIAGCVHMPFGTASPGSAPDQASQSDQKQFEATLLLERFSAQLQLLRLAQMHTLRREQLQTAQTTLDRVKLRSDRGIGGTHDLELASAVVATAGIELLQVTAALKSALASYEARYHERFEKVELVAPVWDERWPANIPAMIEQVAGGSRGEAVPAWRRALYAADALTQHDQNVTAMDAVRAGYAQQFDISQRSLMEWTGAQRDHADATIERIGARIELLNAKAAVLSLMGRLRSDDLPAAPKPGAASLALLFDPEEPIFTPKSLGIDVAEISARSDAAEEKRAALEKQQQQEQQQQIRQQIQLGVDPARLADPAAASIGATGGEGGGTAIVKSSSPVGGCGDALGQVTGNCLPKLDWPPGGYSSETRIDDKLLRADPGPTTFGAIANLLKQVLAPLGYDPAFLSVPNGFALVTKLEQIREDGTHSAWGPRMPRASDLGFGQFIKALFKAPVGRYRVIVFIVTDAPRKRDGQTLGEARLAALANIGESKLPEWMERLPYIKGRTGATALIYEFTKPKAEAMAAPVHPDDVRAHAEAHLKNSGIRPKLADSALGL